ncbi:MAG TPA: hypothetical protein VE398_04515 [Acidobacteriota bacterium]|nr:hypothetical protein [Acidobacteriota bacterium]
MTVITAGRKCPRHTLLALILVFLVSLSVLVPCPPAAMAAAPYQKVAPRELSDQEVEQMLSIAEQQFEIVKILIAQGRFEQVVPEMKKIYDLNLPEKYEQATAESACIAANSLLKNRQFEISHQILDIAFGRMRRNENKAAILKVKAYVYKSEGKLDKAKETFERAMELERQVHP